MAATLSRGREGKCSGRDRPRTSDNQAIVNLAAPGCLCAHRKLGLVVYYCQIETQAYSIIFIVMLSVMLFIVFCCQ